MFPIIQPWDGEKKPVGMGAGESAYRLDPRRQTLWALLWLLGKTKTFGEFGREGLCDFIRK